MRIVIVYLFTLLPALTVTLLLMATSRLIIGGIIALLTEKLQDRRGAGIRMT